jgi:hypothetical protein
LVTALTRPAVAAPYSASNWLVTTWNSWIVSSAGRVWAPALPPRRSSLLLPPSIRNRRRWRSGAVVTLSDDGSAAAL